MAADGASADPASEVEILSFDQPYSNHNSGPLAFGPDGMLYIAVGDGGSGGDPQGHGQDRSDWLGSILRVDVTTAPYTVPADNPFVGTAGVLPEIWAYGVRNPWGMHFDGATLWFADVGQDTWEEINQGVRGGNYGWNVREGKHCYASATCSDAGFVAPLAEYGHDLGASVTGGTVYRGPKIPELDGRYVFADFASGRLWTLQGAEMKLVGALDANPSTFGTDREGRLYIGDYRGALRRFDP
jgi:glucose/arabinose dehydrogenase